MCNYANGDPDVCCPASVDRNAFFVFSAVNTDRVVVVVDPITTTQSSSGIIFGNDPYFTSTPTGINTQTDNRCGVTNASQTRVIGGWFL